MAIIYFDLLAQCQTIAAFLSTAGYKFELDEVLISLKFEDIILDDVTGLADFYGAKYNISRSV